MTQNISDEAIRLLQKRLRIRFGMLLRKLRHQRKKKQYHFAAILGTSQAYVSNIEIGNTNLTLDQITKLLAKLNYELVLDVNPILTDNIHELASSEKARKLLGL